MARFPSRGLGLLLAVLGMAVAVGVTVLVSGRAPTAPARPRGHSPNLVLVIGCTVRRDQLTPYGGPALTTPFLDELASEGVRFDDVVATASWTREAVAGLLTGENSARFGLPDPGPGINRRVLPPEATTLAEHLAAAGYDTVGVTANPNLVEAYGMAQGFGAYAGTGDQAFSRRNRVDGKAVVQSALMLLDARPHPDRPFFLQATLIDTHLPRVTSLAERERSDEPGLPRAVRDYRITLRRMDDAVRALDEGLRERGHDARDTWFVFVADHGEGLHLPQHHGGAHGTRMYRSTLGVPWILRGPGAPAGAVVPGLVSGEDVTPTLLGLLGRPIRASGRDWSGRVVAGGATDRERAFAMSMFGDTDVASVWTPDRVCQRDFGSLRDLIPDGCYDRASDPDGTTPGDDHALQAELQRWRADVLADGSRYAIATATPGENALQQLEELGYLEAEPAP